MIIKGLEDYTVVKKVWGEEHWLVNDESNNYCFKKLFLDKNFRCSYHMHKIKSEHFYIQTGEVFMMIGGEKNYDTYILNEENIVKIVPGIYHSFVGFVDSLILEVSTFHRESDSYRLDESKKLSNAEMSELCEIYKSGCVGLV